MKDTNNFSNRPYAPESAKVMSKYNSLSSVRDALTNSNIVPAIEKQINTIIDKWLDTPSKVNPLQEMQKVLESVRKVPPSEKRIKMMNTIIRTLGQPNNLATYLDMLRDSANRYGTTEQEICKQKLQAVKMHSIYGWCGNTLLVESLEEPTKGTHKPMPGLQEKLGNPTSAWNLTVHIWQPNLSAKGFPIKAGLQSETIHEPPHTHPFDFVSMVVKGNLHQSIYLQRDNVEGYDLMGDRDKNKDGFYNTTPLEHVDGVWPPHDFQEISGLESLEHRVLLREGDSYYMPCDWIHDVEIDKELAVSKPTMTLFLSSEYLVMPHVYMASSMAEFHDKNPNIKSNGKPIPESAWHDKLKAIANYLRGESETLNLNEIVKFTGEYAFFHECD